MEYSTFTRGNPRKTRRARNDGSVGNIPSKDLPLGKADAVRPGLNSRDLSLARPMAKRFAEGGHAQNDDEDRLMKSRQRDHDLETPHYKKGGPAHWIQSAIQKPGSLRKSLRIEKGKKIPLSKLEKAEHSRSPLTRKRAHLSETLKGFHR